MKVLGRWGVPVGFINSAVGAWFLGLSAGLQLAWIGEPMRVYWDSTGVLLGVFCLAVGCWGLADCVNNGPEGDAQGSDSDTGASA